MASRQQVFRQAWHFAMFRSQCRTATPLATRCLSSSFLDSSIGNRIPVSNNLLVVRHRHSQKKGSGGNVAAKIDFNSLPIDLRKMNSGMETTVKALQQEMTKYRTGKPNPTLLDNVKVTTDDGEVGLNELASVNVKDSSLLINVWLPENAQNVENAVRDSPLELSVTRSESTIRASFPKMTAEFRKTFAKAAKQVGEEYKNRLRRFRNKWSQQVKKQSGKDGVSDDDIRLMEQYIQSAQDKYIGQMSDIVAAKMKEITGAK